MATLAPPISADNMQSVVSAGMSQLGRKIYVVSLHYMDKKPVRRDFQTRVDGAAWTDYYFDPVKTPRDRPSVCLVMDGYQRVFKGSTDTGQGMKRIYEPVAELAVNIATDIIKELTGREPSDHNVYDAPAVWISECGSASDVAIGAARARIPAISIDKRGRVVYSSEWDTWGTPEFERRFPEFALECKAFLQRQWRYAEFMVAEGDKYHVGPPKKPENITERHRLAASFIGANSAEHEWIANTHYGAMTPCPFCGQSTSSMHPLCGNCQKVINPAQLKRIEEQLAAAQGAAGAQTPPQGPPKQSSHPVGGPPR